MSAALDRGTHQGAMGDDPGYPHMEDASMDAGDEPVSVSAGVARHQGTEEIDYADDLFKEIVTYVRGGNRSDNILINMYKLDDMRRDHYSSAEEYISDFKTQMNVLRKVKLALHPWWAIGLMIRQLQDELPGIAFIQDRLGNLAANANKTHSARQNTPKNNRHDAKNPANATDPPNQYTQSDRGGRGRGRGNNRAGQRGRGRGRGGRGDKAWSGEHTEHGSSAGGSGPRGAPPRGKDIYKYAMECREAENQRIDDQCSFCGYGPHNAKHCFYLQEAPQCDWVLSTAARSTSENPAEHVQEPGWLLDSGASRAITGDISDFIEFHEWDDQQSGYAYTDVHGKLTKTSGWGNLLIRAVLSDGSVNEALVKGYLDTSVSKDNKILSTEYLADHCGLYYNARTKVIEYGDGSTFGYANTSSGTPYLIGPKPGKYRISKFDQKPDLTGSGEGNYDIGKAFKTLKAYEIHRRLGHAGKPKTAATLENAELIEEGDVITDMDFDCEACIWRMDNGTEFTKFIKWGEKEGMKFEFTPPYTAEPNGIIERISGYVNDIARVMMIDAKLPEKLWPYAVETAIYTINRLANPKSGKSPIQVWREMLGIENAKPSLTHLRPWGSIAYVHIPKSKRVQSRKMAPRATKGHLMGYVGDHGHQFKVWDPISMKIVESRDVGFPQHGREDDDEHGEAPASAPRPLNPSGSGGGRPVSIQPSMPIDEDLPIKPKAIRPQQAALITPSP
ncbi:hypothetical protein PENANT_c071G04033 [Penicillium antarcticum]|uniref:Integrase catalytic domain-containing protein n=1 Tax=Penicillium antarcticum TaxID=416450 RepID=A0A1V6PPS5_9EURO|nr:hypothetical protein PENANT_c071G04033 [Penicillium antarcticum]